MDRMPTFIIARHADQVNDALLSLTSSRSHLYATFTEIVTYRKITSILKALELQQLRIGDEALIACIAVVTQKRLTMVSMQNSQ